jgi:hypothetical protein
MLYGFDAHSPDRAYDKASLEKAERLAQKYNINIIDEVDIHL